MTLCPVCNLKLENARECRRCKTYVGQLIDTKHEAIIHHEKAVAAFENNCFSEMFFHARRSFTLCYSPESLKLLACASILINKFELGYCLWQFVKMTVNKD